MRDMEQAHLDFGPIHMAGSPPSRPYAGTEEDWGWWVPVPPLAAGRNPLIRGFLRPLYVLCPHLTYR